jgi:hypothetical protein
VGRSPLVADTIQLAASPDKVKCFSSIFHRFCFLASLAGFTGNNQSLATRITVYHSFKRRNTPLLGPITLLHSMLRLASSSLPSSICHQYWGASWNRNTVPVLKVTLYAQLSFSPFLPPPTPKNSEAPHSFVLIWPPLTPWPPRIPASS